MLVLLDSVIVLIVVTNLLLLSSSRLNYCIRIVAFQGGLVGFLPLLMHFNEMAVQVLLISLAGIVLKLFVFPWLLLRAMRGADVWREIEPYVGYSLSLLAGVGMLIAAFWIGARLPLTVPGLQPSVLPMAFFSIFAGLFLLISRRKALTQVLGYLVMENGIYIFGAVVVVEAPLMVELGILLDVFMLVFVLGIILFHISRDFEHLDIDRLNALKDWDGENAPADHEPARILES